MMPYYTPPCLIFIPVYHAVMKVSSVYLLNLNRLTLDNAAPVFLSSFTTLFLNSK
jgi:hypothetical protein